MAPEDDPEAGLWAAVARILIEADEADRAARQRLRVMGEEGDESTDSAAPVIP